MIGLSLVPVAGGVVVVISPHKMVVVDCIELVGNFMEIHIQENYFLKKKKDMYNNYIIVCIMNHNAPLGIGVLLY